jgi:hypothetical protein
VACHTRGCGKAAYNKTLKNDCKHASIISIFSSATKVLLKPCAPAPGSDFAASQKALEHFMVAVLVILVCYSLQEVNNNHSNTVFWPKVRATLQLPAMQKLDSKCTGTTKVAHVCYEELTKLSDTYAFHTTMQAL